MGIKNLEDVRIFVQVVESGGLTAAAKARHETTNHVSRRLARLEDALGAKLLNRTTRRLSATEEGRRFYEQAVGLIAAADLAEQAAAPKRALEGRVRIAVKSTPVAHGLVRELVELLRLHPGLEVQLVVRDDATDLVAERIDLAVQVGELPDSSQVARRLGEAHFVLAASPAYLERAGRPSRPSDLANHECLRRLGSRPELSWTLVGPGGREVIAPLGGRFECSDARVQAEALACGWGIAPQPAGEVREAEARGTLERVLPSWRIAPIPVWAVSPPGRARLARVAVFVELLRNVIRKLE